MDSNNGIGNDIPREARKWAMICHISALAGLVGSGIGFVVAPLLVWLIKKEDHVFIDQQGKEAVNFQITMILALFVAAILCFVLIGFFILIAVALVMVILPIIAAVRTNEGEEYRYPFSIRFIE